MMKEVYRLVITDQSNFCALFINARKRIYYVVVAWLVTEFFGSLTPFLELNLLLMKETLSDEVLEHF